VWIIEFGAASSGRDLEIGRVAREEEPPHISTVAFADRGFVKVPAEGLCRDPRQFDAPQRRTGCRSRRARNIQHCNEMFRCR
jgi:hypothetical protein